MNSRDEFEKEMSGPPFYLYMLKHEDNFHEYYDDVTQCAYHAWQASREQMKKECINKIKIIRDELRGRLGINVVNEIIEDIEALE